MFGRIQSVIFNVLVFVPAISTAQKSLYFIGGAEFSGTNFRYKTAQNGAVLRKGLGYSGGAGAIGSIFNAGLHYRFADKFALEGGLAVSEIDLLVFDTKFQNTHKATSTFPGNYNTAWGGDGSFDFAHLYSAPYLSFYYFPGGTHFYLNPGIEFNYNAQAAHTDWTTKSSDGQTLTLNAHFAPRYVAGFLEAGFYFGGSDEGTSRKQREENMGFFIGLRYYQAGAMMDANYQNTFKSSVLYSDHVSASGSYISVALRVGIPVPSINAIPPEGDALMLQSRAEEDAARKGRRMARVAKIKAAKLKKEETAASLKQERLERRNAARARRVKSQQLKKLKPAKVRVRRTKKIIGTPRYKH